MVQNNTIEFIHSRLMSMPETNGWTPQKSDWAFLTLSQDDNLKMLVVKYWVSDSSRAPKYLADLDFALREKFDLTNAELV